MTESTITTVDPHTGEVTAEYPTFDDARIEAAIASAHAAAASWAATPLPKRLELLRALAETLRAGRDDFAALMTREMGKPITEAAGEVEKSAVTAEYYVAHADRILADEHVEIEGVQAWVGYEPLGVIYAVMPWNFPFWQVIASLFRRWPPATPCCSNTARTSPAVPWRFSSSSSGPGSPRVC